MKIKFVEDPESGICHTPCPYGLDCMVNSMECSKCIHYFGLARDKNSIKNEYIKCSGKRIQGTI